MVFPPSHSKARILLEAEEIRDISLKINREFAPRRFKPTRHAYATASFAPQELCNISQQISREFAPRIISPVVEKPAELLLLPVDPRHLHVSWQAETPQPQAITNTPSAAAAIQPEPSDPLTLRVFSHPQTTVDANIIDEAPNLWFDVSIAADCFQQQITLPPAADNQPCQYQVALGSLDANQHFIPRCYSNTATTPVVDAPWPAIMIPFIRPQQASPSSSCQPHQPRAHDQ